MDFEQVSNNYMTASGNRNTSSKNLLNHFFLVLKVLLGVYCVYFLKRVDCWSSLIACRSWWAVDSVLGVFAVMVGKVLIIVQECTEGGIGSKVENEMTGPVWGDRTTYSKGHGGDLQKARLVK